MFQQGGANCRFIAGRRDAAGRVMVRKPLFFGLGLTRTGKESETKRPNLPGRKGGVKEGTILGGMPH